MNKDWNKSVYRDVHLNLHVMRGCTRGLMDFFTDDFDWMSICYTMLARISAAQSILEQKENDNQRTE